MEIVVQKEICRNKKIEKLIKNVMWGWIDGSKQRKERDTWDDVEFIQR